MNLSSSPNTVTISSGDDVFGGIAWQTILATDTFTEIVVAMDGTWDCKDSGAGVTMGGMVTPNGVNLIKQAVEADTVTGQLMGKVQETTGSGAVVRVKVGSIV